MNVSNKTFLIKSTPSFPTTDLSTHKTFASGDRTFSQLTIYSDGEVWYGNDTVAYANGVWEVEYRYLTFGDNVQMDDSDYAKFSQVYEEFVGTAKKLYFRIGQNGEYKLGSVNDKIKGVWGGTPFDNILAQQLPAPVISLYNKVVSWAAIPNASNYALVVDTSSPITVTTTSFDLSTLTLTEGDHTVKVMAKGDDVRYLDSEFSNVLNYVVFVPPIKGQLIQMNIDGTTRRFRVLSITGTIAKVFAIYPTNLSSVWDTSSSQKYNGSTIDTYLNTTWYNSLTTIAKSAIQNTIINQYHYDLVRDTAAFDYSTQTLVEANLERKIFLLDAKDIADYLGKTSFTNVDLWKMFFNTTSRPDDRNPCFLRSVYTVNRYGTIYKGPLSISGYSGVVDWEEFTKSKTVLPAFTIDLSKISWS